MIRFLSVLLVLFLCQPLAAQPALSLSQAIKNGLRNAYQIQIAEKDLEIARNNNTWQNTDKYPTVDFILSNQNSFNNSNNPASFIPVVTSLSTGLSGTLDLNWTLFDGHKVKINKTRLDELERQGIANLEIAAEQTIQNIILSYYDALIQKEQLEVLEDVLVLSRDRVDFEKIKKEYGQSGTFEILQTKDALLNDSTNFLTQQYLYKNAMRSLNLAMGENKLDKRYRLSDTLNYEDRQYVFEVLQSKMINQNKTLKLLEVGKSLAASERDFQESNRSPKITLGAGASQSLNYNDYLTPERFGNVDSRGFIGYLNLGLSYRIWDNKSRVRNIQNAKLEETIAQLNINDQKQQLETQLRNTLETYNSQLELIEVTEKLVANASRNIEIAEERFRGGQINSFDYRTIQLAYINASQSRLNAIFNLKNTETELIRLTGGLVGN